MSQALLGSPTTLTSPPSTAEFFKPQETQPEPQPAAQSVNPPMADHIAPGLPPQPSVQNPVPPPPTAAPQPAAPSPAQSAVDFITLQTQMQQQYAEREKQWMAAMQQQQAELEAARQARAELEALKQQQAIQQQLASDEAFAGLETVSPDEGRRLVQIATSAMQNTLQQQQNEFARQQKALFDQQQQVQQQLQNQQMQRTSQEILARHPDFYTLYSTPQFQQFMMQRDGLSSKTREQVATEEFYAGNSAYVIDMLDRYKGTGSAASMQQVPPVQVAGAPAQSSQPAAQPQMTLAELNTLMQTRQITPDQYRVALNQLRSAPPQQPV